jgi:hypothetical protein
MLHDQEVMIYLLPTVQTSSEKTEKKMCKLQSGTSQVNKYAVSTTRNIQSITTKASNS